MSKISSLFPAGFRSAGPACGYAWCKIRQRSNLLISRCSRQSSSTQMLLSSVELTRFIFIKTTITRRVSRGVNSHVELHPVGLVEGGAGQGGRDHCHRVRSAGYLDDNGFLRTAPPPWSWVRHLCFPFGLGCYCTFIHWSEIVRCSSQQTWQRLKSSIVRTTHTPGVVTPSTRL